MPRTRKSGESPLLLLEVVALLDRHRIPYAVVGAFAVSFYGVVRASMDTDAVISLQAAGIDPSVLLKEFHGAGFKAVYRKGDLRDPIGALLRVEDDFNNRVDLLIQVRGMEEGAFSRTVKTRFMDHTLQMISPEDLVAMKLFAGNAKDLEDAAGVLKVSGKRLDQALLKKLARRYGANILRKLESLLES